MPVSVPLLLIDEDDDDMLSMLEDKLVSVPMAEDDEDDSAWPFWSVLALEVSVEPVVVVPVVDPVLGAFWPSAYPAA